MIPAQLNNVAWSSDGSRLAAVTKDGCVVECVRSSSTSSWSARVVFSHAGWLDGCAYSSYGAFAVVGEPRTVIVLDPAVGYAVTHRSQAELPQNVRITCVY